MREENISKMNFKELRAEVQYLRDELALFKRKYEDAIYNLDSDNFGKSFTIEQNNMKAQIKITSSAIKTMVSNADLQSALSDYSTIEQTNTAITSTVTTEYVDSLIDDTYVKNGKLESVIQQTSEGIYSTVSATYETASNAETEYSSLRNAISSVSQTADNIELRISDVESFKSSIFTQTAYGFTLDGEQTTFTGVLYLTDNSNVKRFSIFYDNSQGPEQVIMHGVTGSIPLVLGDTAGGVYIGSKVTGNEAATRNWVENSANIVAVFG